MTEHIRITSEHLAAAILLSQKKILVSREVRELGINKELSDLAVLTLVRYSEFESPKGSFVYDLTENGDRFIERLKDHAISIIPELISLPNVSS